MTTVTILGREFKLLTPYLARLCRPRPRVLLGFTPDGNGGRVAWGRYGKRYAAKVGSCRAATWVRWVGRELTE